MTKSAPASNKKDKKLKKKATKPSLGQKLSKILDRICNHEYVVTLKQKVVSLWLKMSKKQRIFALLGVAFLIIITITTTTSGEKENEGQVVFSEVKKGDLLISVKESGYLNAVNEVTYKNNISQNKVKIMEIIPDGTLVTKGDLLVELDATELIKDKEDIELQISESIVKETEEENNVAIERSNAESQIEKAEMEQVFAEMELEKFEKFEKAQLILEAEAKIDSAEDDYNLAKQRYENTKNLAEKGFETQSTLKNDELSMNAKKRNLEAARKDLIVLKEYDLIIQETRLQNTLVEAETKVERVTKQAESILLRAEARLRGAQQNKKTYEERLVEIEQQINYAKIFATVDGYALYPKAPYWRQDLKIEKGKEVSRNQTLMRIPDTAQMKIDIAVGEHYINTIKAGQKSTITIDSIANQFFTGEVSNISVLPNQNNQKQFAGAQKYTVTVAITDENLPKDVKPQISASATIIIDELKDVYYVPIQAVDTVKGQRVVYIKTQGKNYKMKEVVIGQMNTSFVEIIEGVKKGDKVLMSKPQI